MQRQALPPRSYKEKAVRESEKIVSKQGKFRSPFLQPFLGNPR
jgi:hypothetical protein